MRRKTKENELRVTYKQTEGLSEEEAQRTLNKVFDILFDETDKRIKAQKINSQLK